MTGIGMYQYVHVPAVAWTLLWDSFFWDGQFLQRGIPPFLDYVGISLVANILPGALAVYTNYMNFLVHLSLINSFLCQEIHLYIHFDNYEEQQDKHVFIYKQLP